MLNLKGIAIHGRGKVKRLLKRQFVYEYSGMKIKYLPSIEGSYDYLLINKYNEPETHVFLSKIFAEIRNTNFIDVGASVGEFIFSVCKYKGMKGIYAFEPRTDCANVLIENVLK